MSTFDLLVASIVVTGAGESGNPFDDASCLSVETASDNLRKLRGRRTEFFRQTDGGNGDRFASRFGHRILAEVDDRTRRYYTADETNLWDRDQTGVAARMAEMVLDEMYSRADELDPPDIPAPTDDTVEDPFGETRDSGEALRSHARRSDTMNGRRNMVAIGTDKFGLRIPGIQHFDRDRSLVACGDGKVLVLGERGVILRERRLEDMCHSVVHAPYDPDILNAPPELVKQFIKTFMPEENRVKLMFKLLGHAIPGGNPNRYFVILKGGTTSGKTQLISALQKVLGRYVGTTPATIFRSNKDDKPRPDVIRMYGKRLAFLPEASKKSWELHASRIKQFTGGDQDPQRAMRSDIFIEERPLCMPVVYTNEMPKIIGMDVPTKRRVIVPTMDHTVSKEDEDVSIKERFINDFGVSTWLFAAIIQGYIDAQREGMEDVETEFSMSTKDGTGELYHLSDFLEWALASGRLEEVPAAERETHGIKSKYVTLEAFHSGYVNWCKVFGNRYDKLEQLGFKEFNAELRDNHGYKHCRSGGLRWEGYKFREATFTEMRSSSLAMN